MADWTWIRGLEVPTVTTGAAGTKLKAGLDMLARGAPHPSADDPTANDDSTDDFVGVGSLWLNTSTQTLWICTDDTNGAAKWRSLFKRIDNAIVLAPAAAVGGTDNWTLQIGDGGDSRGVGAIDLQSSRTNAANVAAGARSAILGGQNNKALAIGSTVAGGASNNAGGWSGTITGISAENPTKVTSNNHGLTSGQRVSISGSNSTPTINSGLGRIVTVVDSNRFTVPVNVTGSGDAGTWSTATFAENAFVAGGSNNKSIGMSSHSEGSGTTASGDCSHAEGSGTTASGFAAHAEGIGTSANAAHAEGFLTTAAGYSHAEGYYTAAITRAGHAEGQNTIASGWYSHAEGISSIANGYQSHAEGASSTGYASSHAEGAGTYAGGIASHSEGYLTQANGHYSHAGGIRSNAHLRAQWARASGGHNNEIGTAQTTITHLFSLTSGATTVELTLDGESPDVGNRFALLNGQTLSCLVNIVGRKESGGTNDHGSFLRQVCIRRSGGTTQLVGTSQKVGVDINPANWGSGSPSDPITITADDTNDSLQITVSGVASAEIRWMATVMASEVAE